MYNLNISLAETAAHAANNLLIETNGPTPRTPEILNSLIAMTNPLDNYFGDGSHKVKNGPPTNVSTDSNSSSSSQLESPTANNPPSVQHTCSQLIKAGLKLTIEQKRKLQQDCDDFLDLDKLPKRPRKTECSESEEDKTKLDSGLTPEDEERRRRRRERNKIAATKCRLKKRERTANLITESETLETQNLELKNQVHELQQQKRTLEEVLAHHRPQCQHQIKQATRDALYKLPPVSSVIENHSYSHSNHSFDRTAQMSYSRSNSPCLNFANYVKNNQYKNPPKIIVEEINDNSVLITNLDNPHVHQNYYNQCHNYPSQSYSSSSGLGNGCLA
ncbi:activating transcription factor 3 [Coccinella septempunctata]|uniref:activating transcription factor 3 n=1 Tax=Coccinella septempunctata TaxID=41139 RepID=UPI001D0601D2|nr:activating transcription factor 3 [Coccinella septempunctata]